MQNMLCPHSNICLTTLLDVWQLLEIFLSPSRPSRQDYTTLPFYVPSRLWGQQSVPLLYNIQVSSSIHTGRDMMANILAVLCNYDESVLSIFQVNIQGNIFLIPLNMLAIFRFCFNATYPQISLFFYPLTMASYSHHNIYSVCMLLFVCLFCS